MPSQVEHSSFKLLSTSGEVLSVELQQMGRKRSSKGVLALDGHDNKLEEKNAVEVTEGALMRTQGTVKHGSRSRAALSWRCHSPPPWPPEADPPGC